MSLIFEKNAKSQRKNVSRFSSGAMWRYPEPSKARIYFKYFRFSGKILKSQNFLKIWLWRYVALCGAIPNRQKLRFFNFCDFWENPEKSKISQDLAVALCGAILNPQKLRIFQFFDFWEKPEKSKISQDLAVALCGAILNPQKLRIFWIFSIFAKIPKSQEFLKIGCGAMWRYPEPSKN